MFRLVGLFAWGNCSGSTEPNPTHRVSRYTAPGKVVFQRGDKECAIGLFRAPLKFNRSVAATHERTLEKR